MAQKQCPYDSIAIIYNPKSTGSAGARAKHLEKHLVKRYGQDVVTRQPTRHAGHAKKLAFQAALANKKALVISVSGDGGYHEVINGVMQAVVKDGSLTPVVAVEGAGNANDHYRYMRNNNTLYSAITNNKEQTMELICVRVNGKHDKTLYSHSYWGIGLTAVTIDTLNKKNLNPVNEKMIVMKELAQFKPVKVIVDGQKITVNNIIAAKIGRMAKVLKLDAKERPAPPGKLHVLIDSEVKKSGIIRKLFKGITKGLQDEARLVSRLQCSLTEDNVMQLDGEVYQLAAGDKITVSISSTKLLTL